MKRRSNTLFFAVKDFLCLYKKTWVCFLLVFFAGVVIGIVSEINAVGGDFERIPKAEMTFGAVKVFFLSAIFLFAGYGAVMIAACVKSVSFVAVIPFAVLGYLFGAYTTVLVGAYGGIGVMNLIFIYMPFYLATFCCMTVAGSIAIKNANRCRCENKIFKPSVSVVLKGYAINIAISFVIFLLIGAVTKVVVVTI